MMKNTLRIIQTAARIAEIVAKVIKVVCIVASCLCLAGLICLGFGSNVLELGGITLHGLIEVEAGMTLAQTCFATAGAVVVTAVTAVVAHYLARYCHNEQLAGTPFTAAGAKELFKTGLITAIVPLAAQIVIGIAAEIIRALGTTVEPTSEVGSFVGFGIALLAMALLCAYGAELTENKAVQDQ